ncbi:hypothetical protein BGZ95_003303 [Linnemannia exigua]|uniref:HTH CENPB-type domain-containing protein n=1 Tax=Linnemannia exigua TaxID=604196 RepID=A0AAD4H2G8_9FUNG|nr:hypothetical protein BGZ95_003303 [Linnemannia exigua]
MNNHLDAEDETTVLEAGGGRTGSSQAVPGTTKTDVATSTDAATTPDVADEDQVPRMTKRLTLTESQKYEVCAYMREQELAAAAAAAATDASASQNEHPSSTSTPTSTSKGSNAHHLTNKDIAKYILMRYQLKVNESTVSRLRAQSADRLSKGVVNPALKRHRAVLFPELEARLRDYVVEQAAAQAAAAAAAVLEGAAKNGSRSSGDSVGEGRERGLERDVALAGLMRQASERPEGSGVSGSGLSDIAILTRARELARELKIEHGQLAFSDGWLFKFKARHGMRPGGALASSVTAASSSSSSGTGEGSGTGKGRAVRIAGSLAAAAATAATAEGSMSPPPVPVEAFGSGASSSSTVPQQQQPDTTKSSTRSSRAKRQRIDRSDHAGETGDVEGLDINGINIEEEQAATAKPRKRYNRRGKAGEDATTMVAEDGSELSGVVQPVSSRGRRSKLANSTVVTAPEAVVQQDEQELLDMGIDMDMDSHMNMAPDMDDADLNGNSNMNNDDTRIAVVIPHQRQQVHPVSSSSAAGRGASDVVMDGAAVAQMDMLSKVYATDHSSMAVTAVEQQQHQQHQQKSRQRSTRLQQQQQPATNELFSDLSFPTPKIHKSAVPPHTSSVSVQSSSSQDAIAGHSITSAAMNVSTAIPSTHQQQHQPILSGLGMSGTNTAMGTVTSNSVGSPPPSPPPLPPSPPPLPPSPHTHQLRIPAPTTASRTALSLSIQDPIAASFQPQPSIDFTEAAQCVYTLNLFMQQQRFDRTQIEQLGKIYSTLRKKREEGLHQGQSQGQRGGMHE